MSVTAPPPILPRRLARSLAARISGARASAALSPTALRESWSARTGGHPVDADHQPHLHAALEWLARAQDATPDGGFSRGYSLTWNPYFRAGGWQPSYPETTGYIVPTLLSAARLLGRPDLAGRARRAAAWEVEVQLPSGAVRGGVIGQPPSPAVFNTGQVILGWLSALEETGEAAFADAARRAGRWLTGTLGEDGHWREGNSRFARADATAYNARAAWALAEAGVRLGEPAFVAAAARNLRAVAASQEVNGWLRDCCLHDPARPLLHTLAYTARGLLEGGRVLEDAALIDRAGRTAGALAGTVRPDGRMPGRFRSDWSGAAEWSCLTGEAQMANVWLRLHEVTGERGWVEPVGRVLRFLKSTQNRSSADPGLRGGILGSWPAGGGYGRYEVLNWATKFFSDALLRHDAASRGGSGAGVSPLA